jgi:hypothetical protein
MRRPAPEGCEGEGMMRDGKVTNPLTDDERWAIGMYAVLDRDACDFLDMLEEGTKEQLTILLQMLECPGGQRTDTQLNKIGADIVRKRIKPIAFKVQHGDNAYLLGENYRYPGGNHDPGDEDPCNT